MSQHSNQRSLGFIQPGGSVVRLTDAQADPTESVWAYSYRIYHVPGNVADAFVGDEDLDSATGEGVLGVVYVASGLPYESPESGESGPAPCDLSQVWIEAGNVNDQFLISYLEG